MKKKQGKILIIISLGLLGLLFWRYYVISKEKRIVQSRLAVTQANLVTLEGERKLLVQELARELKVKEDLLNAKAILEQNLAAKEEKLSQVQRALDKTETEKEELDIRMRALAEEKARLEEKLSTVDNLKKALRDLKIKLRQDKQKKAVGEGNLGYIVKDGVPTSLPNKKVNVIPLP